MDIFDSPSGRVVRMRTGYNSFIPNKLPPSIAWETKLVLALSEADTLLGMLAREGQRLSNPHLLIRPFVAKEAVLSSQIEGTQATLGEVLADEAGALPPNNPDDIQEVQNYILALNHGIVRLAEFPLSLRLIKEIHALLMQGVRGAHATPGEFRRSQNWIGAAGCTLNTAKYIPPPPEELMAVLGDLEFFLHDTTLPPLIHAALCHYQFEAIHPFLDGNGRVGRLLITLLLMVRKVLPTPLLYLSAFFERTRDEYYHHLYAVSHSGAWREWLIYFLNGVALQAEDALSRAERINQVIESGLMKAEGSLALQTIIRNLAMNPYLTTKSLAERLKIAFTTAQRSVHKLEALGIIKQVSDSKRNRLYCALPLLAILEEPARIRRL